MIVDFEDLGVTRWKYQKEHKLKLTFEALDQMANGVKGQHGYIIEVQGFSSGKGQAAITTSQKMAESVVRYLVLTHEIPVYRVYLVAMGNAPVPADEGAAKSKSISGGRVEISLLKNDLEQLASK